MRIVVVEDNVALARGISYSLQDAGHSVDLVHDGLDADSHIAGFGADLVLLDINLPGCSGIDVLRAMRRRQDPTPVILLTARSETEERVRGLDSGADDYLVKPFEMAELEARIRAIGRRTPELAADIRPLGDLEFDVTGRRLLKDGVPLKLTRRELAVLEALVRAGGRHVGKEALVDHVYGVGADVDANVVEPHISRLRKRLAEYGLRIVATRGIGYVLELPR